MAEIKKFYISLTQNRRALIDEIDHEWLNQWRWQYHGGYAQRSINIGDGVIRTIKMHRIIMGTPVGMETDHINGDKLDNRRLNLRVCTHLQNSQNRKVNKNKKYKGVNWHRKIGKWQVSIRINKQLKHIGYVDDPKIGAVLYNQQALMNFGEFARLNDV